MTILNINAVRLLNKAAADMVLIIKVNNNEKIMIRIKIKDNQEVMIIPENSSTVSERFISIEINETIDQINKFKTDTKYPKHTENNYNYHSEINLTHYS